MRARDTSFEQWLWTEGVARYDAYHADPSRGMPAEQVWRALLEHMKKSKEREN